MEAKVPGIAFRGMTNLLEEQNICPITFCKTFGLLLEDENSVTKLFPFSLFVDIIEELKRQLPIIHPGLLLAKKQLQLTGPSYVDLILSAPNLQVALELAKRFRYTYSEVNYWDWSIESGYVLVKRQSYIPTEKNDREHCLYSIAFVFLILKRFFSGDSDKIERILFIQPEDTGKNELEKFFHRPLSFGQDDNGFILSVDSLYRLNKNFDQKKYQTLLDTIECHHVVFPKNQLFSTYIKSLILQTLSTGNSSLEHIARLSNMHPRAIQRKLAKEGFTYKSLVNEIRLNLAKRLLVQEDISMLQISSILGYSDASAFSRAMTSQLGCSPRSWRKSQV
jgi:AraC-like DNA-binding protein